MESTQKNSRFAGIDGIKRKLSQILKAVGGSIRKNPFLSELGIQKMTKEEEYRKKLIEDIRDVKISLEGIQTKFNMTSDSDLIEALIYEERALNSRYSYLLRLAKTNGIVLERYSEAMQC